MVIEVSTTLRSSINGFAFEAAPTVAELHSKLGPPSRVVAAGLPAPVGHRNNHIHVYNNDGIYFYEHHYTRRISGCNIVLWPEELNLPFAPTKAFSGDLLLPGYVVPPHPDLLTLLKATSIHFTTMLNILSAKQGDFAINIGVRGPRLASGRRSKKYRIMDIGLSWPHDPWGLPAA